MTEQLRRDRKLAPEARDFRWSIRPERGDEPTVVILIRARKSSSPPSSSTTAVAAG